MSERGLGTPASRGMVQPLEGWSGRQTSQEVVLTLALGSGVGGLAAEAALDLDQEIMPLLMRVIL